MEASCRDCLLDPERCMESFALTLFVDSAVLQVRLRAAAVSEWSVNA